MRDKLPDVDFYPSGGSSDFDCCNDGTTNSIDDDVFDDHRSNSYEGASYDDYDGCDGIVEHEGDNSMETDTLISDFTGRLV